MGTRTLCATADKTQKQAAAPVLFTGLLNWSKAAVAQPPW
jgi:hypothetical protein